MRTWRQLSARNIDPRQLTGEISPNISDAIRMDVRKLLWLKIGQMTMNIAFNSFSNIKNEGDDQE